MASVVNEFDENIISDKFQKLSNIFVENNIIKNNVLEKLSNTARDILPKIGKYSSVIENELDKVLSSESLIIGGILGSAVSLPIGVGYFVNNVVKEVKKHKINKCKKRIENDKYQESDKNVKLTEKQKFFLNIIKSFLTQRGIYLRRTIETKRDLIECVEELTPEEKRELNYIIRNVSKIEKKLDFSNEEKVKLAFNFIKNSFILGSASMTVGETVKKINEKLNTKADIGFDRI